MKPGALRESGRALLLRALKAAQETLYPPRCALCDATGPPLCGGCRAGVVALDEAVPLLPPGLAGYACAGVYGGTLGDAVRALKYRGRLELAPPLGELLAEALRERLAEWRPEALVPVALHPWQRLRRGFNQAELLARRAGRLLDLPVEPRLLRRVRLTKSQAGLGRSERLANMAGAFAAGDGQPLAGRRLVLVDDVCTTGATLAAAARPLRQAGAKAVYAISLAWEP